MIKTTITEYSLDRYTWMQQVRDAEVRYWDSQPDAMVYLLEQIDRDTPRAGHCRYLLHDDSGAMSVNEAYYKYFGELPRSSHQGGYRYPKLKKRRTRNWRPTNLGERS